MQFNELNIHPSILKALKNENYEAPTPIQEAAIPIILEGRDLLGCAQTGTGKTAAFAIPTLQILNEDQEVTGSGRSPRCLVLTPTRELALQIYDSFCNYGKYTKCKACAIFGGVPQNPQVMKIRRGVDVLVATPGRLNDLMNQGVIDLKNVKILILDEADRMLDMGFINDVKKIVAKTPDQRQTLLFSATIPPSIADMARKMLKNPVKIEVTPDAPVVDLIDQSIYYVDKENKANLLIDVLNGDTVESALVFARTKHGADKVVKQLAKGNIAADAIHGDKSQGARQNALNNFKNKNSRVLVATDIAARGIDIDGLSHVINYDLPYEPETYVHRIGRTGRAGLDGSAISFCDLDEIKLLVGIEKLLGKQIDEAVDNPYPMLNNSQAIEASQPRIKTTRASFPNSNSKGKNMRRTRHK